MTTTREAALEAALQAIADLSEKSGNEFKRLHPTLNGMLDKRLHEHWHDVLSEFAAEALSTPATEPQGLVENDTIDSFCLTLRRLVSDAYAERDRFGHIAATIRINALHHGATNAEVEAMLSGEISFINWIADKVEARHAATPAPSDKIAEAARISDMELAASVNAENEACAKMLDSEADDYEADASRFRGGTDPHHFRMNLASTARKYAAAIRSRGVV